MNAPANPSRYSRWEDVYGLAISSMMVAVGAHLLNAVQITTGGTVGLSLLLSHLVAMPYSYLLVGLNLPLFLFGWRMVGRWFMVKSVAVTAMTAVLGAYMSDFIPVIEIEPIFAAVAGGTIVGMGALAAARHGAAAGGTMVVVLWLQRTANINAGLGQLVLDLMIVSATALLLGGTAAFWSAIGIIAADGMIITWYRPGRFDAGVDETVIMGMNKGR